MESETSCKEGGRVSIVAWILFGLIPGFLDLLAKPPDRQPVRVRTGYSK